MGCVGTDGNFNENGVAYGGGIYTAYSTLYNCIIAENEANANYADGAGVCMEVGEFYNNTVLKIEQKDEAVLVAVFACGSA